MTEQIANVMGTAKSPAKSINQCLLALGANRDEVYCPHNPKSGARSLGRSNRSIYDRHSKIEIYNWAKWLRKRAMEINHPDKHLYRQEYFTELTKEINEAFNRLVWILEQR